MANHPNRSTKVELEIVGGLSAGYMRKFTKRRFPSVETAGKYMGRIADYLDEMGVRAAHPMFARDASGRDVTADCWMAVSE